MGAPLLPLKGFSALNPLLLDSDEEEDPKTPSLFFQGSSALCLVSDCSDEDDDLERSSSIDSDEDDDLDRSSSVESDEEGNLEPPSLLDRGYSAIRLPCGEVDGDDDRERSSSVDSDEEDSDP